MQSYRSDSMLWFNTLTLSALLRNALQDVKRLEHGGNLHQASCLLTLSTLQRMKMLLLSDQMMEGLVFTILLLAGMRLNAHYLCDFCSCVVRVCISPSWECVSRLGESLYLALVRVCVLPL